MLALRSSQFQPISVKNIQLPNSTDHNFHWKHYYLKTTWHIKQTDQHQSSQFSHISMPIKACQNTVLTVNITADRHCPGKHSISYNDTCQHHCQHHNRIYTLLCTVAHKPVRPHGVNQQILLLCFKIFSTALQSYEHEQITSVN